jgi:hypothetical protein
MSRLTMLSLVEVAGLGLNGVFGWEAAAKWQY